MPTLTLTVLFAMLLTGVQERGTVVAGELGGALDAYLTRCEAFGFSGAVLVEQEGALLLRKGYGLAREEGAVPNSPETLFDIASASKQVTAAAILLLEAEGKLSLDDSIAEHLPGVPRRHAEVTLRHLLTHTSGFPRDGPAGSGPDLAAALDTYFSGERSGKAGKRFEYYNGGYAMLAGVVEQVTGEAFEDWVRAHLFGPAGLRGTDFVETARVDRALLAAAEGGRGRLTTEYIRGWGYKGMGGVLTSVSDLALWIRALHGGQILPSAQLEALCTPFRDDYALGWYVFETDGGRRVVQHGGTAPGFQSYIRHFVDDGVLILVLANCEGMHWQVAWGLSGLVLGEDPKAPEPPALAAWPEEQLSDICRTWEGDLGSLVLERAGPGVSVGVLGGDLMELLSPRGPGERRSGGRPTDRELKRAGEQALEIVAELREGRCERMEALLRPGIPKGWPSQVRDRYWPAHVKTWGPVRGHELLGTFFDPASGRTRVWIELDHASGPRSVEVAFAGASLNILDLNARRFPLVLRVAPVDDERLAAFDFTDTAPLELRLTGRAGKRALELRTASGKKGRFR